VPTLRQVPNQLLYLFKALHDHFGFKSVFLRQHSLDLCFKLPEIGLLRFEQNVSAVDVGAYVFEAELLKTGFERRHADHIFPRRSRRVEELRILGLKSMISSLMTALGLRECVL